MVIESDGMAIVILSDTISFVILSFCSMIVVANTPVTERILMRMFVFFKIVQQVESRNRFIRLWQGVAYFRICLQR